MLKPKAFLHASKHFLQDSQWTLVKQACFWGTVKDKSKGFQNKKHKQLF
jgi:hypothetical protein